MPLFHNNTKDTLRFDIDGERFEVPPGAQCEIARRYAWVPAARGLPLTAGSSSDPKAPTVEPTDIKPERMVYPKGVESGPSHDLRDDDNDDEEDSIEPEKTAPSPRSAPPTRPQQPSRGKG